MTTVRLVRSERGIEALTVEGHSGYAQSGSDIICSAASVLITTCVNALESVAHVIPLLDVQEKKALISVSLPKELTESQLHDAQIIMETCLQGYRDMAAQYNRFIQII